MFRRPGVITGRSELSSHVSSQPVLFLHVDLLLLCFSGANLLLYLTPCSDSIEPVNHQHLW